MPKKIYITEAQLRAIMNEMAYPVTFNMDDMLALRSYSARLRYCNERLRKIGQGSSRVVYAVDNEKVLKVAKNQKGIAQNNAESDYYLQTLDCFAKVYDTSNDGIFVEMQAARKAKASDFNKIVGYDFEVVCAWIDYVAEGYTRNTYRNTVYDRLFKSEKFMEELDNYNLFYWLNDYLCNYQIRTTGDLKRLSSWGVVQENGEEKLVIIDFGLNDDIYDEYYKPRR